MAIRLEDEYTNIIPASAAYPAGSFKNETAPGNLDGTPLEIKWQNDTQGILQKLLDAAGITASGTSDTILASDYYDALVKIFGFAHVYDDTGIADAYELALRSDAAVEDYQDGQVISFMVTNTNTGASTAQIDALGAKDITYPDGSPLLGGELLDGSFVSLITNTTDDRLELWVWVPAAYNAVITGNRNFIYSYQKERVSTLDGGVLDRNYSPLGTFPNGAKEVVLNVGATANIIFDSGGLASSIGPGNNTSFIFNTTSGSWEILKQPFTGALGTSVNNANGNPNISDTQFFIQSAIASATWESVGPTASGADNIWTAMDTIPGGVDWIRIRVAMESSIATGTPDAPYTSDVWGRKTGSSESQKLANRIATHRDTATSGGDADADSVFEVTLSVDSSKRFDMRWFTDFTGSFTASAILVGWGFND